MSILKFFGLGGEAVDSSAGSDTDSVRRIVQSLNSLETSRAQFVACFAYLLGRVAHADSVISEEEVREMERLVVLRGGLPEAQAVIVVQIAKVQNQLFGSTENFLVAREFDKISSRPQKLALLDCLYAVSAAEGGISLAEDNEIRRISQEFNLAHKEFITVRLGYKDQLNVLDDKKL